jgi:hypothetical protein
MSDIDHHPTVLAFVEAANSASYHHADDSAREWHLAKPHERECQRLYDEADEAVKAHLRAIKGRFLISLRTECRS